MTLASSKALLFLCKTELWKAEEQCYDQFHEIAILAAATILYIQATTAIVDTVIVESTAIVEQKPLTTQFYLLLVESPL